MGAVFCCICRAFYLGSRGGVSEHTHKPKYKENKQGHFNTCKARQLPLSLCTKQCSPSSSSLWPDPSGLHRIERDNQSSKLFCSNQSSNCLFISNFCLATTPSLYFVPGRNYPVSLSDGNNSFSGFCTIGLMFDGKQILLQVRSIN